MKATQMDSNRGPEPDRDRAVSQLRLHALRAVYALIAVVLLSRAAGNLGEASVLSTSVSRAMFTAVGLLALLGLRYPLQMLPLMLFDVAWKAVWLLAYGLPLWLTGETEPAYVQASKECAMGMAIVLVVLPWRYLVQNYVRRAGESWWHSPR
jgi:hypothetical protein